ncbi:MAG: GNAT family N-acetyltransferase [Ginsengibacter sp.]
MIKWNCKNFTELNNEELYKILQLRNSVFVVEQNCPYQDCDDKDQHCYHLMGWKDGMLVAYSRLIPPGIAYKEPSIGRVVTATTARGKNIGRRLMMLSIRHISQLFDEHSITIGAQLYLKNFYESFGFVKMSDIYLEDGIEHIKMHLS